MMNNEIGYGRTYKMSGYDVICVGFTKSGKAKMQTLGMTSGRWPGEGDISKYDEKTKAFSLEWRDAISKFRLPSLKRVEKNDCNKAALKTAAENYSSFGATYGDSWLGSVGGSSSAWYVHQNGYVGSNGDQSYSFVVAPAFNLDTSKVIVEGNKIKRMLPNKGRGETHEARFVDDFFKKYSIEDITGYLGVLLDETSDMKVLKESYRFCQDVYNIAAKAITERR